MSEIAKYTLIDSLAGLKFQFRINKFQTDVFFCWTLRIFGCTLDSGEQLYIALHELLHILYSCT